MPDGPPDNPPAASASPLLESLTAELTRLAGAKPRHVVVLPVGVPPHRAPQACLQMCLGGDPAAIAQRGCDWLRQACAADPDATDSRPRRCGRGCSVAAQRIELDQIRAVAVWVGADAPTAPADEPSPGRLPATAAAALEKLESLSRVLRSVSDLVAENQGLAEEVLRSYEQLNVVFDFTRRIAQLTEPRVIRAELVQRVAELLDAADLWLIGHAGECEHFAHSAAAAPHGSQGHAPGPPLDASLLSRLGQRGGVFVHDDGCHHLLVGVLEGLDDQRTLLIARRERPRPAGEAPANPFTSGELMLVESLLSLGVQILNNSELHTRLRRMSVETTRALVSAIDKKDHYTCGHSERVGLLARLTGEQLGLPEHELQTLEWAGLLHDVGKIGVPEEVLTKPGKLTDEEWQWIQRHPTMGYEILKPIASFTSVLDAVLYHHENPDGTGYPHGLKGDQIPLFARIVHVVDVFDALSSDRSYRPAFSLEQTLDILRNEAGTKLDETCVLAFFQALENFRRREPRKFAELFPSAAASAPDNLAGPQAANAPGGARAR